MKRIILPGTLLLAMFLMVGCAARGPFTEERKGNVITYSRPETGNAVTVTLGDALKYDKRVRRDFMGASIEGHLYRAGDDTSVLVSSMVRKEFEDLIGRDLEAWPSGSRHIRRIPPGCRACAGWSGPMWSPWIAALRSRSSSVRATKASATA
ncbi:hypothetical protein [Desulfovibrio sp. Fe33]|uniref:hypothetical protein n=1 Tax=Desulfovibrio sp. Fe33 TaxID=3020842 RepID=UPI00234C6C57|nr:hypothetical protein [Desulfovibrio sp. Fe33]